MKVTGHKADPIGFSPEGLAARHNDQIAEMKSASHPLPVIWRLLLQEGASRRSVRFEAKPVEVERVVAGTFAFLLLVPQAQLVGQMRPILCETAIVRFQRRSIKIARFANPPGDGP